MPSLVTSRQAHQARAIGVELAMLGRLTRDLPGWLRSPFSLAEAGARVRGGLAARDRGFLMVVERAIYGSPDSPYLALLRHAGCELGDLRQLVQAEGLEGALQHLAALGVYVTFDEFKGRRVAVRGSARFQFTQEQFDSPLVSPHWVIFTGGTRGTPGRVLRWLPLADELAAGIGATFLAHDLADARHIFWLTNPIIQMLNYLKLGQDTEGWLYPIHPLPFRAQLGAHYFVRMARLNGRRLPMPRFLDMQDASRLATWLAGRPRDGRPLAVNTMPSSAVRVAQAAHAAGIDLTGVTFHVQSEPVTDARHQHLTDTGARVLVNYGTIETPTIGYGCAAADRPDDLHVFENRFALIERERLVTERGPSVAAMLVTTLTDRGGKICLNVETGDYGHFERRACTCLLGALGLTLHLSDVRSFEKLSGEGVTFVRSRLIQVLEEVLPARFGGSTLDYQLVEEEGTDSSTRIVLRISPSVGPLDEGAVRATLLAELASDGVVDRSHAALLDRAGSVVISRELPLATEVGKVLPFHLLRTSTARRP